MNCAFTVYTLTFLVTIIDACGQNHGSESFAFENEQLHVDFDKAGGGSRAFETSAISLIVRHSDGHFLKESLQQFPPMGNTETRE